MDDTGAVAAHEGPPATDPAAVDDLSDEDADRLADDQLQLRLVAASGGRLAATGLPRITPAQRATRTAVLARLLERSGRLQGNTVRSASLADVTIMHTGTSEADMVPVRPRAWVVIVDDVEMRSHGPVRETPHSYRGSMLVVFDAETGEGLMARTLPGPKHHDDSAVFGPERPPPTEKPGTV